MTMWNDDGDKKQKEVGGCADSISTSSRTLRLLQVLDIMEGNSFARTVSNVSDDDEEEDQGSICKEKDLDPSAEETPRTTNVTRGYGEDEESFAPNVDAGVERAPSPGERYLHQEKNADTSSNALAVFGVGMAAVSFGLAIALYFMPC